MRTFTSIHMPLRLLSKTYKMRKESFTPQIIKYLILFMRKEKNKLNLNIHIPRQKIC